MSLKSRILKAMPSRLADTVRRLKRRAILEIERRDALQRRINRSIDVPGLPRRRRQAGSVWAVCMAKNEADIVGHAIRHMLDQGVDGVIVVDNRSDDETRAVLTAAAAEDARLYPGVDSEVAFHQGRKVSYLAHLAWRAGADWVVPFDADEFWFAEGCSVADRIRAVPGDRAWSDYRNVYPLVTDGAVDLDTDQQLQVDAHAPAWLRIAFRARRWVWVGDGNHDLRTPGPTPDLCLHMLHFSYRSLEQYSRKAEQGVAALEEAGMPAFIATHWRDWATLSQVQRAARWTSYLSGSTGSGDAFVSESRVLVTGVARWSTWDPDGVLAANEQASSR
jgi:hypothetical protein